jgi:hypothetical protein
MRGLTVAIVAGVVVVLVAAALYLRSDVAPEPPPRPVARPAAPAGAPGKPMERSARVEERLGQLRDEAEKRQGGVAKVAPDKREMPTMTDDQRAALERKADSTGDDDDEDPEEMAKLKQTLMNDPDPEERIGAILMLTGEEGPESLHMLLDAMSDPDAEVRLAVVEALGDRAEELSADTLTPALRDPDPEVRFEAVSILGDMDDDPEAKQMVKSAKSDPDPDVSELAGGIDEMDDAADENDQGNAAPASTPRPGQPKPNAQPQTHK